MKYLYLFVLFVLPFPLVMAIEHTVEKTATTHEWAFSKKELKEALIAYLKAKGETIPAGNTYTAEWGAHKGDYAVSLWVEEGKDQQQ